MVPDDETQWVMIAEVALNKLLELRKDPWRNKRVRHQIKDLTLILKGFQVSCQMNSNLANRVKHFLPKLNQALDQNTKRKSPGQGSLHS